MPDDGRRRAPERTALFARAARAAAPLRNAARRRLDPAAAAGDRRFSRRLAPEGATAYSPHPAESRDAGAMGQTRVIYTDATTAEAATVLKGCGFVESNQGGLFTSPSIPIKAYVVWGKSSYYPEILAKLDFAPRIQIHLKCRESVPDLEEMTAGTVAGLRGNAPGTRIRVYNADALEEIAC